MKKVRTIDKKEIKEVIVNMFQNINVEKVEEFNINNGVYSDGTAYTEVTINYKKGGDED